MSTPKEELREKSQREATKAATMGWDSYESDDECGRPKMQRKRIKKKNKSLSRIQMTEMIL